MAIANLAGRQHGVVARRQLVDLGVGAGSIRHRLAAGRLHRVFRGVFAVGHPLLNQHGRWMAATLTCGNGALLSHRSAAALWGLAGYAGSWIDVTAPGSRRCRRSRIALHGGLVVPEDRAFRDRIPVTSVSRTLIDLAEVVDARRLRRAIEAAERLQLLDLRALARLCERSHGRRGLKPLRGVMADLYPMPETRSELERRFVAFCRESELSLPVTNRIVEGFEVDAVWTDRRLVIELDSYEFHRTRAAFERDRERDAALQLAGYRVLRVTWRRLTNEPAAVTETVRHLLA